MSTPGTRRRAGLLALFTAALWVLVPSPSASAHATLLASTPPAGYAVASPPTELTLDFDEPVSVGPAPLHLVDAAGHPHVLGTPSLSLHGRRLSAPVGERLSQDSYRARWEVTADDGDLVSGTIAFTVGTGAAPMPTAAGGASLDSPVVIVWRWVLFTGLALALGGLAGQGLARRTAREAGPTGVALSLPRPLVLAGGALGLLAAAGLAFTQVGFRVSGLATSTAGRILLIEVCGFGITTALGVLARTRRGIALRAVAVLPLLAVVVAEGWRAHPHADAGVFGAALTVVHLSAAAVWVGALAHVLRCARRWRTHRGWTRVLVYDYARLALILVLVVVATGTAEAVVVLPSAAALVDNTYGRLLLAKIAVVALAISLAVLARRRLRDSIRHPDMHPLGGMARRELTVIAGVLAMTAVLVSAAPPGPATTGLAAPPPPVGLVVPAGTLAGQVTVLATASDGQLVLRLGVPGSEGLDSDEADTGAGSPPAYRVGAELSTPGQNPNTLALTGCGAGCFTAPVHWQPGTTHLRLTIAAGTWHGGGADLDIEWPPRTDPTLMPSVLAAMRAAGTVSLHEAVTSDYTGYPGTEHALTISGTDFVASEPYANGGGNPVVLGAETGQTRIGLAFPQGYVLRLVVGPDHRILHEDVVSPNHLITRTFDYTP